MKGDTMPEFSTMLDLQAQMMLLLAIGVFLAKKKLITDQGRACLTDLLLFIILPANIIQSFRIEFNAEIFRSTRDILILSILLQVLYGVVCAVCYNRYSFARKAVMQYGTVCSNAGFLGSPLAEGLFGGVGLLLTSFYLIPQRIVMWSVGVSYFMQDAAPATPEEKKKHRLAVLRKTITHPCIASVFVGMVIMLTQWQLPTFLGKAVQCTSNCNMTMSMFLIGAIIGSRDLHPLLDKDAIIYCIIRLFLKLQRRVDGPISHAIEWVGRRSLFIFCIHTVELTAIPWYLMAAKYADHPVQGMLLQFVFSLVSIFAVTELLMRRKELGRKLRGGKPADKPRQRSKTRRYAAKH